MIPAIGVSLLLFLARLISVQKMPISVQKMPISVQKMPISVQKMPISVQKMPISVQKMPISVQKMPISVQKMPISVQKMPISVQKMPISVQKMPISVQKMPISVQKMPISVQKMPISVQKMPISVQKMPISVQKMPISVQKMPISVQKMPISVQKMPISVQKMPISVQKMPISVQKMPISVQKMPISVQKMPISVQKMPISRLSSSDLHRYELIRRRSAAPFDGHCQLKWPKILGFIVLVQLKKVKLWRHGKTVQNELEMTNLSVECLQICYKSELAGKLATGTSKFGGRFRLGKRVNERPLSDCAGVVARNEWHALNVSKISDRIFTIQSSLGLDGQFNSVFDIKPNDFIEAMNISKDFGPIETDFLKTLHLGAFMKDFDGMAFRILALDLLSSIGQNGTGLCKIRCMDWEPGTNTTTLDWEPGTTTTITPTTTPPTTKTTTMSTPTTTTVPGPPHFCKRAVETPNKNKTFGQKCPNGEQFCYLFNCSSGVKK
uniref:Uncharacterized protein n=1 Tax=Globodera rostochiensis TaxID=31243 RepID=A0A914I4I2_GLORO